MEGVDLAKFVSAAATAGFDAITLNSALYADAKAAGFSDRDIGQLIVDHGLCVSGIDPLFNWLPAAISLDGDDAISICSRASAEEVFHLAQVAGTDLVNAPLGLATPDSEQQIVDCFASLCESAAQQGLRVSLEFMPFTQVSDLATAARIVTRAGCSNGGIMFDCWHHHRSGGQPGDVLAVPGEKFFALQLDDAMPEPMDDIIEETLNHRMLPGEGCIDLLQTLGNLKDAGASFIYDVEVFKDELRSQPADERARQMFDASAALLRRL